MSVPILRWLFILTEDIRTARMTDMHVKQANDLDDILGERGQTIPTTLSTYKYARGSVQPYSS